MKKYTGEDQKQRKRSLEDKVFVVEVESKQVTQHRGSNSTDNDSDSEDEVLTCIMLKNESDSASKKVILTLKTLRYLLMHLAEIHKKICLNISTA